MNARKLQGNVHKRKTVNKDYKRSQEKAYQNARMNINNL